MQRRDYWTGRLAERIAACCHVDFPPYVAHALRQEEPVLVALSAIRNDTIEIGLSYHAPFNQVVRSCPVRSPIDSDRLKRIRITEEAHLAARDESYVLTVRFDMPLVTVDIRGDPAASPLSPENFDTCYQSIDILAQAVLFWHRQTPFVPLGKQELVVHRLKELLPLA
jgi:hypothetical protein